MASKKVNRSLCCVCGKVPSLSYCTGCKRVFCTDHSEQHRLELSTLLDKILNEQNQCKQKILDYTEQINKHPLMIKIHDWETESIEKIQQVANDARKQIINSFSQFATSSILTIKNLTEELIQAQDNDSYIETDLKQWMDRLVQIKKDLDKPPMINIQKSTNNNDSPLISKILVQINEIFDKSIGKIAIKDDGKLMVNIGSNGYGTVRCKGEYLTGKHRFRFKIEPTTIYKWILIGIVSKNTPLKLTAFDTPTTFGWISNDFVCLNGKLHSDYNGYKSDLEKNDIIQLFIDCNQKLIRITNERTRFTHELIVDLDLCPFPWQIQLGLYYSKDRIRLLWK